TGGNEWNYPGAQSAAEDLGSKRCVRRYHFLSVENAARSHRIVIDLKSGPIPIDENEATCQPVKGLQEIFFELTPRNFREAALTWMKRVTHNPRCAVTNFRMTHRDPRSHIERPAASFPSCPAQNTSRSILPPAEQ